MPFHRNSANPAGYDAFPVGYDFINNPAANTPPGAGVPAQFDGIKSGGPNDGTYFVGFGDDGTSRFFNRAINALADNCDTLDNYLRRPNATAVATALVTAPPVGVTAIVLPNATGVYLGTAGLDGIPETATTLFEIVDQNGNEITNLTSSVQTVVASITGGALGSGFATAPITLNLNQPIPSGVTYRVYYGIRSNLAFEPPDNFVSLKLWSAHKVPAEVVDFERQITRTDLGFGTTVNALVATIIETPGHGARLPESPVLVFDVDAFGTFVAGLHHFQMRKWRDSLLELVMWEVTDDTSIANTLGRTILANGYIDSYLGSGGMATVDMLAVGGPSFVPYTSNTLLNGDQQLRIAEAVPPPAAGETLFQRLNATWTTTIGDGAISFGDFSGAHALTTALAFIAAHSSVYNTVVIQAKAGTYILDDSNNFVIPLGVSIEVRGVGRNTFFETSGTSAVLSGTAGQNKLVLSDCTVIVASGTRVPIKMVGGALEFENVQFVRCGFQSDNGTAFVGTQNAVWCRGCSFQNRTYSSLLPCPAGVYGAILRASDGDNNYLHSGYLFEDCTFEAPQDTAPVLVQYGPAATPGQLTLMSDVRFVRCDMHLGTTTSSGGNPVGNCGVINVDPAGSTSPNQLKIDELTWTNCTVLANNFRQTPGAVSTLLMLRPATSSTVTIPIGKVTIEGGEWLWPQTSSLFCPFYIGGYIVGQRGPDHVCIRDVKMGGTAGSNTNYGVMPAFVSPPAATGDQAAFFIGGSSSSSLLTVDIDGWYIVGSTPNQNVGDIWIDQANDFHVADVNISVPFTGGGGAIPHYRVRIAPSAFQVGSSTIPSQRRVVDRVVLNSQGLDAISCEVDHRGIFQLVPNGRLVLRDCSAVGFGTSNAVSGFEIPMNLNGSPLTNAQVSGLELIGCTGEYLNGNGFNMVSAGTTGLPTVCSKLVIRGCHFNHNAIGWGIKVQGVDGVAPMAWKEASIDNNSCCDNGQAGIFFQASFFQDGGGFYPVIICNNHAVRNNIGNKAQISVGISGAFGSFPVANVYGNNCRAAGDNTGDNHIGVRLQSGASLAGNHDDTSNSTMANLRGVETNLYTVGSGVQDRYFGTTDLMLHNNAYFTTLP